MSILSSEQVTQLLNVTLSKAKYFLKEADEFYPFATVIDSEDTLKPTGAYMGEEYPDAATLVKFLEEAIQTGISNKKYKGAAIAIDSYITTPGNLKETGIEIRLHDGYNFEKKYYLYRKIGNEYQLEETD